MKPSEHPILFSGPMVRAILDGRKKMTRRVVKSQHSIVALSSNEEFRASSPYPLAEDRGGMYHYVRTNNGSIIGLRCPHGKPGDRLWVRETFALRADCEPDTDKARHYTMFKAKGDDVHDLMNWHDYGGKWEPSIFMPRWASRITLELTGVRIERLQSISAKDIIAEGAVTRAQDDQFGHNPVSAFDGCVYLDLKSLWAAGWNKINGKRAPWASNPFVWVLAFRRLNAAIKE